MNKLSLKILAIATIFYSSANAAQPDLLVSVFCENSANLSRLTMTGTEDFPFPDLKATVVFGNASYPTKPPGYNNYAPEIKLCPNNLSTVYYVDRSTSPGSQFSSFKEYSPSYLQEGQIFFPVKKIPSLGNNDSLISVIIDYGGAHNSSSVVQKLKPEQLGSTKHLHIRLTDFSTKEYSSHKNPQFNLTLTKAYRGENWASYPESELVQEAELGNYYARVYSY